MRQLITRFFRSSATQVGWCLTLRASWSQSVFSGSSAFIWSAFYAKTLTLPNLHERRKTKKSDERKNSTLGILIILGVYFSFLPNRFATSSIIDFVKGEPEAPTESFDLEGFSRIPVLRGGRVKPIDSVARNTLLVLRNKRTALDEEGNKVPAIEWFAEVLFNPGSGR